MPDYAVKDLTPGMVVWESCQYGNMRHTVVTKPEEVRPGYWECETRLDRGGVSALGGNISLYREPAYCGVRFVCDPNNIPAWMREGADCDPKWSEPPHEVAP